MEKVQAFVKMNEYVMKQYTYAYASKRNATDIFRYRNTAYGAFEMFDILYPDYLTEDQFDEFWEFYNNLFEALM